MVLMKHVVVDISAHGFGHVAQTAAVLNALPEIEQLTIRTRAANEKTLCERLHRPFRLMEAELDTGMIMRDALTVDVEATMDWYREFHSNYQERRASAARQLERLQPDCLLSNVPYLSLDAAGMLGIPNVGLCSLNWADIFLSYCQNEKGSAEIHNQMVHAYEQCDLFLQPTPSMPMDFIPRRKAIAPVARVGQKRPLKSLVKNDAARFILVGVGGVALDGFPLHQWPRKKNVYWIWPDSILQKAPKRADFLAQSLLEQHMSYIDLLASSDLVITKTGYGTQTEAVVNQVPAICINRPDWPEHACLQEWHNDYGHVLFCDWSDLVSTIADIGNSLLDCEWNKPLVFPSGAQEAASILQRDYLS
ncbi:L-arabinokinase [Fistulifera solaris]|uniref:L-arabinokinase n=1 Tax=Fistulifera solaris TaxID=1519565 RepID=A0A1Z5JTM1_FISSO|nr:L-arabinokinase [Fistulifera solaris]|eukprot:GAX17370.1 L-arabinokinase [Fistulifera solaris]